MAVAPSLESVGVTAASVESLSWILNGLKEKDVAAVPTDETLRCGVLEDASLPWLVDWKEQDRKVRFVKLELPFDRDTTEETYRILSSVETASELALYDGIRFGASPLERGFGGTAQGSAEERMRAFRGDFFSLEVQKRILLGTALLMPPHRETLYWRALENRWAIQRPMEDLLRTCDVVLGTITIRDLLLPALSRLPALSFDGYLLIGRRGGEETLLRMAKSLERRRGQRNG